MATPIRAVLAGLDPEDWRAEALVPVWTIGQAALAVLGALAWLTVLTALGALPWVATLA